MQPKWFETFFQGAAVEFWNAAIPEQVTASEVSFLTERLDLRPGSRVLDIACGAGRHGVPLGRAGCRITGVDFSEEFLACARRASPESTWIHGDLHGLSRLVPAASFDASYCMGNSFGYLAPTDVPAFFRAVAAVLVPGGRLLIDTGICAETILGGALRPRWHRLGDLFVLSDPKYVPEDSRIDIAYTFVRAGVIDTRPTTSYVLTSGETVRTLRASGFGEVELFGSVRGDRFQLGSERLLVLAKKG